MKNDKDIVVAFDEEFSSISPIDKTKKYDFEYCDGDKMAERLKDFLLKALKQNDTKWKDKIRGLRMEYRKTKNIKRFTKKEVDQILAYEDGYNSAVHYCNQKINQLLEEE